MAIEKRERWGRRQRERGGRKHGESQRKGEQKGDRERMRGTEEDTEDKNEKLSEWRGKRSERVREINFVDCRKREKNTD